MRSRFILLMLFIFFMTVAAIGVVFAYTTIGGGAAGISSQGTIPIISGPLLDDFNKAVGINTWGDVTGSYSSESGTPPADAICTPSYTDNPAERYGVTGYSLKLAYNVSKSGSYAGYWSRLGSQSIGTYGAISFWVKGDANGRFFKVELKNTSTTSYWDATEGTHYYRNAGAVYITDYLDGGVTTTWQKVTIPLEAFANLDGLTSMKELVFTFECDQCEANSSSKSGIIYIDNISFETTQPTVLRIDHFGDKIGVCALGGNIGNMPNVYRTNPGARYTFHVEYEGYPYGLYSEYTVNPGWAGHFIIFGGGNVDSDLPAVENRFKMGWIAVAKNLSAYTNISFSIKGAAAYPYGIKIEITDATGNKWARWFTINTSWQTCRMPLSSFTGLDKSTIKKVSIVYEDGNGGSKVGAVSIDKIQFEK